MFKMTTLNILAISLFSNFAQKFTVISGVVLVHTSIQVTLLQKPVLYRTPQNNVKGVRSSNRRGNKPSTSTI